MPEVAIIIPVYNEAENIVPLIIEIKKFVPDNFEVLFIDDGSTDYTLLEIETLSASDARIKCISFSRNFGHQNAMMAGMDFADAEYIITMDGDLQHPPSLIPEILNLLKKGSDIVSTQRNKTDKIPFFKKHFTKLFYRLINFISDIPIEENVSDFRGFNSKVLFTIRKFKERDLFLRGLFSWIGFKKVTIPFEASSRKYGKSKYGTVKMVSLALRGATSFSFKPLRISLLTGTLVSLLSFILLTMSVIAYYQGKTVPGWASLMTVVTFMGGIQLLVIGLMGEYIASLFRESKKRPVYIINQKINVD